MMIQNLMLQRIIGVLLRLIFPIAILVLQILKSPTDGDFASNGLVVGRGCVIPYFMMEGFVCVVFCFVWQGSWA